MKDARFSSVFTDPRFIKTKKNDAKITIDDRFKGMLQDKEFTGDLGKVDKYGRLKTNSASQDLSHYYKLEKNELDFARGQGNESSSEEESELESDAESLINVGPFIDEDIPMGDETHRIAIVNLDWDHIKVG